MDVYTIILVALVLLWDPLWWLAGLKQLAPWRLKAWRDQGRKLALLDARTGLEYRLFHIPGARQLTAADLDDPAGDAEAVVVICMSGHRSPPLAHYLAKRTDRPVYNLTGGMLAWLLVFGPVNRGRGEGEQDS